MHAQRGCIRSSVSCIAMPNLDEYLNANRASLRRRPVRAAADSQRQGRQPAQGRRAAGGRLGRRTVSRAGVGDRSDRDRGPSDRLRRVAAVAGAPTVLVYGHYDVQPPDPLDEWITPPFEPTRRDGNLYARGATDDKGQMLTHVKSAEAWLKTRRQAAGEPQVPDRRRGRSRQREPGRRSSTSNRERLACDVVVISDTSRSSRPASRRSPTACGASPTSSCGSPGPSRTCTRGTFGGAVTNPANALAKMLAALRRRPTAACRCPASTTTSLPLTRSRARAVRQLCRSTKPSSCSRSASRRLTGEEGFTTLERRWARPTCDINGLSSGYQGEGAKTVLPAKAGAKFSFRLVPNQDPQEDRRGAGRRCCKSSARRAFAWS